MRVLFRPTSPKVSFLSSTFALLILIVIIGQYLFAPAYGAKLGPRSLSLSDSATSASTLYALNITIPSNTLIGSMKLLFCSNDPIPANACVVPSGLDVSQAALTNQTGMTGFIVSPTSNANTIVLIRPPAMASPGKASYTFTPIVNPSSPGSYFVRIQTYATSDGTGPASDFGGAAFAITNQVLITATVPPYLLFCTAITIPGQNCANAVGDYIDFGNLSTSRASSATSQMLAATNAALGYAVTIDGTTLSSGNNVITALAPGDVSRPGTSQFGFNLRANSTPNGGSNVIGPGTSVASANYNQPNTYRFAPGDTIIATTTPDDVRVYTSNYVVNVSGLQPPGIYVSTVTYVCLANF